MSMIFQGINFGVYVFSACSHIHIVLIQFCTGTKTQAIYRNTMTFNKYDFVCFALFGFGLNL